MRTAWTPVVAYTGGAHPHRRRYRRTPATAIEVKLPCGAFERARSGLFGRTRATSTEQPSIELIEGLAAKPVVG
jgi:hypothetical protein